MAMPNTYPFDPVHTLATGPQNVSDNQMIAQRGDNYGAAIVQELNGKYAEAVRRGEMFVYTVTTAAALLLSATTGNHPTIWNPAGSGRVFWPVAIRLSFLSGTTTISSLLLAVTRNCGSTIAATAPIVTFTKVTPLPALVGSGAVSKMFWAPDVCTFVAAPTVYAATNINLGAAAPTGPSWTECLLEGSVGIMPGNALSLTCSVTTTTSLWFTTIWGIERELSVGM
jgi:hypothetical protein